MPNWKPAGWVVGQVLRDAWGLVVLLAVALWCAITDRELDDDARDSLLYVGGALLIAGALGGWLWVRYGRTVGIAAAVGVCVAAYVPTLRPPDPREDVVARLEDAVVAKTKTALDEIPHGLVQHLQWDPNRAGDRNTRGLITCTLHYSNGFNDGSDLAMRQFREQVESNLGCRVDWHPHTPKNYVRINPVYDTLPKRVDLVLHTGRPWYEIPTGVRDRGAVEVWDLKRSPHALLTSSTAGGKTTIIRAIVAHALANRDRHGWRVRACDPKRIELLFLRGMPGVERLASTHEAMVKIVADTKRDMDDWYAAVERGEQPAALSILLVIDEVAELVQMAGGVKGQLCKDLASILRLGRKARVHVVLATQRPDVEFVPGEARSNIKYRVATAPLDQSGSSMVFGDAKVGQGIEAGGRVSAKKGRVLASDDGMLRDAQAYWVADPVTLDPDIGRSRAVEERNAAAKLFPTPRAPREAPESAPTAERSSSASPPTHASERPAAAVRGNAKGAKRTVRESGGFGRTNPSDDFVVGRIATSHGFVKDDQQDEEEGQEDE